MRSARSPSAAASVSAKDRAPMIKVVESFLSAAATESAALSDFCNAYAELTHSTSDHKASQSLSTATSGVADRSARGRRLHKAVSKYSESLEALRESHRRILEKHSQFEGQCGPFRPLRGDWLSLSNAISYHAGLSERALQTCCLRGGGPDGGLIHANGLIASDAGDGGMSGHEMRIVMLSAIRASIAKVKGEVERLSSS